MIDGRLHRKLVAVFCALLGAASGTLLPRPGRADDQPRAEHLRFFETTVRPLLARHCYACHGRDAPKPKGGLRLDTCAAIFQGGDSGPVVVAGRPAASLLIEAVRYASLEMPPRGRLSDDEVEQLVTWVKIGAPYPASDRRPPAALAGGPLQVTQEDRQSWAYSPIRRPALPPVAGRERAVHPIDAYLRKRLESHGVEPNPTATPRELIRRAYFDLIGLPPAPEEVDRFVVDSSPQAWKTLIDELLESPQYGERWGRHWLDVVRFAQTNGYERDDEKPFAWRYRDYVVRSLNADKPYDRFVVEQLAGDELDEVTDDSITATAFYRLGVWDDEPDDMRAAEYDGLDDMLSTVGQVFLGQTIGCARCHDHMFDPIPQQDYYRLLAFLRNVKYYVKPDHETADETIFAPLPSGHGKTLAVREQGRTPPPTHLLIRGDAGSPSHEVQPGVLQVLSASADAATIRVRPAPTGRPTSGRRRALAEWIASPDHPLTARVLVNRVWQHHFGRGIVETPNDFGRAGIGPTHPELLDWLAAEFMAGGWSIKTLHRAIMTSEAYRMSSRTGNPRALEQDPGNRLWWRQSLRRLDAEAIRDAVLAVSGQLNPEMGGRGIFPQLSGEVVAGQSKPGFGWDVSPAEQRCRRSVYVFVKRGLRDPLLDVFDFGDTTAPLGARTTSTVAPQALTMLNSGFIQEQTAALAARISADAGDNPTDQIQRLFRLTLGRGPSAGELAVARDYLARQQPQFAELAGQVTFRPNVPKSLFGGYRRKLSPEDYLLGPREAWSYHPGVWGGGYEGIEAVDVRQSPFALWQGPAFVDGTVRGRIQLHHASELAQLLIRALPTGDAWEGYAIELDPKQKVVSLVHRARAAEVLQSVATPVPTKGWQAFRLEAAGSRVRFWLGDNNTPLIDVEDDRPIDRGRFGLSTWGAALSLNALTLEADGSRWDVAGFVPASGKMSREVFPGWSRYGGHWIASADGSWTVGKDRDARIMWDDHPFENGEVSVELRLAPGRAFRGGLLVRARQPNGDSDTWSGYEVSLDLGRRTVSVAGMGDRRQSRAEGTCRVVPGRWHHLRVVLEGPRIRAFVDGAAQPQVDFVDADPLPRGLLGLRTWDSEIAYRNLAIKRDGKTIAADFRQPAAEPSRRGTAEQVACRQALQALCKVMLNLNEFIYVD